jgi:outer membrane protein assembly factor BamB
MYTLNKEIRNVMRVFFEYNDQLYFYTQKDNSSILCIEDGKEIAFTSDPLMGYYIFNDKVYLNDINGKSFIMSDGALSEYPQVNFVLYDITRSKYLPCYKGRIRNREYYLYDLEVEKLIPVPHEIFPRRIWENVLLKEDESTIARIHPEKLDTQWTFSLASLGTWTDLFGFEKKVAVTNIIGAYEEDLWIGLNNGKVLVVNVESGVINYSSQLNGVFPATGAMYVDDKNQKIIGLFMYSYWEVDMKTLKVSHHDLESHFREQEIHSFGVLQFDEDYIYFFDKDNCKVGILDRNTIRLIWQYTIPQSTEEQAFPMEIQKIKDTLYILDNSNTLRVFRKG